MALDTGKKFQTIDNFAAADAWSGNFVGKYFDESEKGKIAKWLFSKSFDKSGNPEGIGLSLCASIWAAGLWSRKTATYA